MTIKTESNFEYVLVPYELAAWLDEQRESWWTVDGDPWLTGKLDFPCPGSELAEAIRQRRVPLRLLSPKRAVQQHIGKTELDALCSTDNRRHDRTFLLRWEGSGVPWLLVEDQMAQEQD